MPPKKIDAILGKQLYIASEKNDILKVEDIVRRCEQDPIVANYRNVDNVRVSFNLWNPNYYSVINTLFLTDENTVETTI